MEQFEQLTKTKDLVCKNEVLQKIIKVLDHNLI